MPVLAARAGTWRHLTLQERQRSLPEEEALEGQMRKAYVLAGAILAAVLLAVLATTPPGARGLVAGAAQEFSAGRAMADVRQIASAPHPTGSAENARVRSYIAGRMARLGMDVSTQQGTVGERGTAKFNRWTGRNGPPPVLTNVIGVLPGTDRSLPAVLLMAHHDTVWGSPGAADDTAGIAVSLEVVRAIRERGPQRRDLIVLATDAEELGLEGARLFFAEHPMRTRVGAVINMEARGGGGRTTLFQTSAQDGEAVALYADAVARPGASSLSAYVYSVLPNDTDLTPVLTGPYTAYNFAFIGRSGLYHSPKATPERLDQGSLQDMGGQVLDLTSALLKAEAMPGKAPDRVFFDLFGLITITYPVWLGWVMLALGLGGCVAAMRGGALREIGSAAGRTVALLLGSAALITALNVISMGPGKPNYYDRLAAIPRLEAMALLGGIAALLAIFGPWRGARAANAGALLPLALLALAAQAIAPTAAYILVLPVMLGGLALAAAGKDRALIFQVAVATLVTGYMLALGHQLMQGVGPTMAGAAALPLTIAAVTVLPLWTALPRRTVLRSAAALLLAGLAVALWVRFDAPADTIAAYADTKS